MDSRRIRHLFVFSFFVALNFSPLYSQLPRMRFDHVSVDQGLSNFTPLAITQDRQRFLWIGTEDGLNRFDGHTFKIYRRKSGDSTSLDGTGVMTMLCDREGELWVSSYGEALLRYDPATDAFQRFRIPNPSKNFRVIVTRIMQMRDGLLWICTNDGVFVFNKASKQFHRVLHSSTHPDLRDNSMTLMCEESDGSVWIVSYQGMYRFFPRSNRLIAYPLDPPTFKSPAYRSVSSLAIDQQGTLWITTIGGVLRFDRTRNKFVPVQFKLANGHPIGELAALLVYVDRQGILWFGMMGDGLVRYDPRTHHHQQYRNDPDDPHSMYNDRIMSIYEDESGVFWVGNYRAGLNRCALRQNQFMNYRVGKNVYAILEDADGELWFGTTEGLYRTKLDGALLVHYTDKSPAGIRLDHAEVYSLARDSLGEIWIGTGGGVNRFSKRRNTVTHYTLSRSGKIAPLVVKSLCIDRDGELWAGVDQGPLYYYDRRRDRFQQFVVDSAIMKERAVPSVWSIHPDADNVIWFASMTEGLIRYDKRTMVMSRFQNQPNDSSASGQNALYFVREDNNGNLWTGQFGNGLLRLNKRTHQFKLFEVADGLPNNFVKGMLQDSRGYLWFSTDHGLARFDPASETFKNYRETDGLHGNVLLSGAYHKGRSGRFYFGGENGVTAFFPDSLRANTYNPPVVIASFKVFDKAIPPFNGWTSDPAATVRLGYRENFLSFEFVSMDFTAPEKNQFAYKLEGVDNDWIHAGTRRYARYTQVHPGKYTFRVKATNSDGVWSSNIAFMHVVVVPPPWERWWFRVAAALLLIGLGIVLYNYRVNRLLEIERLRVRIASDLHDDIGSSLTKISLQSELIQEDFDPEERQNYLKNIATMSRELVTSMSDIVWSIDARNDSIENLIDKMRNFGTTVLSARDISFNLAHSGLDAKKKFSPDVRENLYLIYKEAINNVAKHANASRVNVVLRNDSDKFTMVIVDDGKGWEGQERPSGHGTKNMKMRAARLGGTVEFVRDEGTRVILTMKRL